MADLRADPAALRAEQQDVARRLALRVAEVAMAVAMTDHELAAALHRCAQARPHRREALLGLSTQARARAARQWQLYARWRQVARTGEAAPPSSAGRMIRRDRRREARPRGA
jgi:hypothetical protein